MGRLGGNTGRPAVDLDILIENVMNALAAGVIIGCIYGLMCVGLGLIFGVMKVINFAQGELLMLGMYVSLYLFSDWGLLAFLGPYVGPFVGAMLTGPVVFVGGMLLHRFVIAHVSGMRTTGSIDDGHFGQLIITLGISLILQNGGLILFGSTPQTVRTPLSSRAFEVNVSLQRAGLWDEVKDRLSQPGTSLSGGQQQRLCIARTIAINPEVILMDEPTSALDPLASASIEELIDELRANYAIVIVTHNMQQAARVSQRTAYFHLGDLVEVGPTDLVFTNPQQKLTEDYITGRIG